MIWAKLTLCFSLCQFISTDAYGICVRVFCDFGKEFEVSDPTGEEPKEIFIQTITQVVKLFSRKEKGKKIEIRIQFYLYFFGWKFFCFFFNMSVQTKVCTVSVLSLQGSPGVVTCMDNQPHGLQTGQSVIFKEVNGMVELNGTSRQVSGMPHSHDIILCNSFFPLWWVTQYSYLYILYIVQCINLINTIKSCKFGWTGKDTTSWFVVFTGVK